MTNASYALAGFTGFLLGVFLVWQGVSENTLMYFGFGIVGCLLGLVLIVLSKVAETLNQIRQRLPEK